MRTRGSVLVRVAGVFGVAFGLATVPALAQQAPDAAPAVLAACGAADVQFSVKADPTHLVLERPSAGKAMVVLVDDVPDVVFLTFTVKAGMDGKWMGATRARQYMSFEVEPGKHHLCASFQSKRFIPVENPITVHSLYAEAGKTYYFRVRLYMLHNTSALASMDAMDEDAGQLFVQTASRSLAKVR